MELLLTQDEADSLTVTAKRFIQSVTGILEDGSKGKIPIKAKQDDRKFSLIYFYSEGNMHIQFFDDKTKLTLIRINMNNSFHKNADGERVSGNRVNLFSEQEFYDKGNGYTHTKAFSLPHGILKNTDNFLEALDGILNYTNTDVDGKLQLSIAGNLNI